MFKKVFTGGSLVAAVLLAVVLAAAHADTSPSPDDTATPIKHVVVIFGENISFDHYFGTYPNAANLAGETAFQAKAGTPAINGLNNALLTQNPNSRNPERIAPDHPVTCSQNHGYGNEQKAFDMGLMDRFVEFTAGGGSLCPTPVVMDYYDGNTVTGLWNLAQSFALNDNSFGTNFGPSTVGAINLISGQTHGSTPTTGSGIENGTVIGDPDPPLALDDCANGSAGATMSGRNVGDLMNARNVSWGWFEGGFRPTDIDPDTGRVSCRSRHNNVAGASIPDYVPHHEPFEYYPSTANQHHTPPASIDEIGHDGGANHQYDLVDFDAALAADKLPQVSFVKASAFEDAHPSNSDPLDEQHFVARTINALEESPEWGSTAVILAYDDSDGWYDHQMSPIISGSAAASDALTGAGHCGTVRAGAYPDRCGYGPRQPLMVISPYAKQNYVDHTLTDQTSVLRFIEDNWHLGEIGDQSFDTRAGTIENMFDFDARTAPKVFLDELTGVVTRTVETAPPIQTPTTTVTQTVTTPGATQTVTTPGPTQTITTPGPTQTVTTPGPTQTVNTPGPTVTTPGETRTVTTPGPTQTVTTPGATHTVTTPGPTVVKEVPSSPGKAPRITLRCTTSGSAKKIAVACSTTGRTSTSSGETAVRVRLMKGRSVLATARGMLEHGHVKTTLRLKRAAQKGSYTLAVTVTQPGTVSAQRQTIQI